MGVLIEHSDSELGKCLEKIFQRIVTEKNQEYIPLGNLKELFQELKEKKIYIGLATADTYESAKTCMKRLGVLEYLDYLGACLLYTSYWMHERRILCGYDKNCVYRKSF